MKRLFITAAAVLISIVANAQYGKMEPRADYREAFTVQGTNIEWSREVECDSSRALLYTNIAKCISISVVVDNIVIGKIESVDLSGNATFSSSRLPWDTSTFNADVIYELREGGYKVTVSNIHYKCHVDSTYSSIYSIIYNQRGELRARGDGDLQYFDNAFCDKFLLK